MIDLKLGDELTFEAPGLPSADRYLGDGPAQRPAGRLFWCILVCFSRLFLDDHFPSGHSCAARARPTARFLRAFRKASGMEAVMVASEQFRPSPLVAVFDFGYEEVERQVKARGSVTNRTALERTLQLGISEESPSWSAT